MQVGFPTKHITLLQYLGISFRLLSFPLKGFMGKISVSQKQEFGSILDEHFFYLTELLLPSEPPV